MSSTTGESAIVGIYQEKPDLLDAQVETAIDYLIRVDNAEAHPIFMAGVRC